MAQIKQKALELSVRRSSTLGNDEVPVSEPYDTCKWCQLCQVLIESEVYLFGHLRGRKHLDAICEQNGSKVPTNEELENFNVKYITEAPNDLDRKAKTYDSERLKQIRKRSNKLKQKLLAKAKQFEDNCRHKWTQTDCSNRSRISKLVKDLSGLSSDTQITGQWPQNMIHALERIVNELEKTLRLKSANDLDHFAALNGVQLLTKLLARILVSTRERPPALTDRANQKLCSLFQVVCAQSCELSDCVLQSHLIVDLLDIVWHRIGLSDECQPLIPLTASSGDVTYDPVIGHLCRLLATLFETLFAKYSLMDTNTDDYRHFEQTVRLVIRYGITSEESALVSTLAFLHSYIVSVGMIDRLSMFMVNTRGAIDERPDLALFLQNVISLFTAISQLMALRVSDRFGDRISDDDTQLMLTLRMTHICGVVSLVYGVLLHSGAPVRSEDYSPPEAPQHTLQLTLEAIRFINYVALLDINLAQVWPLIAYV